MTDTKSISLEVEDLTSQLQDYKSQLSQVEYLLLANPNDSTLLKLKEDLSEIINLTLNLNEIAPTKAKSNRESNFNKKTNSNNNSINVGSRCYAKYSLDNKYYICEVVENVDNNNDNNDINENSLYKVRFLEYGGYETVPFVSIKEYIPVSIDKIYDNSFVKALHPESNLFSDAVVQSKPKNGLITVKFIKDDSIISVDPYDIQFTKKKFTPKEEKIYKEGDSFVIPSHLAPKISDSQLEKEQKKKKIKALKFRFNQEQKEFQAVKRQKSWQDFQQQLPKKQRFGFNKPNPSPSNSIGPSCKYKAPKTRMY